jgi:phenylacetate-CoA ligase
LLRRFFGPDLDKTIEDWPGDVLRAYQQAALAEQLKHVYLRNEFYRPKCQERQIGPDDFRVPEDLRRFPFTSKEELLGNPWVLVCVPRQDLRLVHTSTGTTGGAWSYQMYTWDDMHVRDCVPMPWRLLDVHAGDVVINALPYEMSSAGQSFQRSLQGGAGAVVVPVGKGGFYSVPDKTVQVMADLRADLLITTPPYAMHLAEVAGGQGLRPGQHIRLRGLWLTGEGCSRAYRRRLEALWHCRARLFYGSLECGPIGLECQEQSGCHVCAGHVYIEVVDSDTGEPLAPGKVGEVVCTTLLREASPLIRFRTRDLAFLETAPCGCGLRLPRLHVRGRMIDRVSQGEREADEPPLSPYQIEDVLYNQPEMGGNYQIYHQGEGGKLRVDVELSCEPAKRGEVLERLHEQLARLNLPIELTWVEHIPRTGGKTRRIRPLADRERVMGGCG